MNRGYAAVVSLVLVGAALEPLVRSPRDDGFPLSTYPMFAEPRDPRVTMSYAYGVTADGERRTLSTDAFGTREVMQAFATLQFAASRGPWAALHLCGDIALRVRGTDLAEIRVVTATFDAVAYFTEDRRTGDDELEHARCQVPR